MRLFTKKFLKEAVHNCVAHPMLSVIGLFSSDKAEEFHNRNADWAFGSRYPKGESTFSMSSGNNEVIWLVKDIWTAAENKAVVEYPVELLSTQVMSYLENFNDDDWKRVTEADMTYPIIISRNGKILDGCHRLWHIVNTGSATTPVVQLSQMPVPYAVYGTMVFDGVHYSE